MRQARQELRRAALAHLRSSQPAPRLRYRQQALRHLAGLATSADDVRWILKQLRRILEAIPDDCTEDISGYHHRCDVEALKAAIRTSAHLDDFLSRWLGG